MTPAFTRSGGAVADVAHDATAYRDRRAAHNININGVWLPEHAAAAAPQETAWTRSFFADVEPHQSGAYLNFLDRDDGERLSVAWGHHTYERLAIVKALYDPADVFRTTLTVRPEAAAAPREVSFG